MSERSVNLPSHLWELLETMARDMGMEPSALVNQAVFNWARTNGYFEPSQVPLSQDLSGAELEPKPLVVGDSAAELGLDSEGFSDLGHEPPALSANPPKPPEAAFEPDADEWNEPSVADDGPSAELVDEESAGLSEPAPAWQETDSPESLELSSKPVNVERPTVVHTPDSELESIVIEESGADSQHDFERLLADLEDLESDMGTTAFAGPIDPNDLDGRVEVAESSARLRLLVDGEPTVEVGTTPFLIGRAAGCDLQIHSERVSREHAVIEKVGSLGFRIVDRGSSNGVWLGRERIQERMIRDGDILRIGDRRVRASLKISGDVALHDAQR